MRVLPIHVIPIFMGQCPTPGQVGAQIRYFDVYYKMAPVVGFHVLGCQQEEATVAGFSVMSAASPPPVIGFDVTAPEKSEQVAGFYVGTTEESQPVVGFDVTRPEAEETPVGLSVSSSDEPEAVVGFSVTKQEEENEIIGFIVRDTE